MPKVTTDDAGLDPNDANDMVYADAAGGLPIPPRGFDHPPRNTLASLIQAEDQGPPCPSLCDVGPCVNLHSFDHVMVSAQPTDGSLGRAHIMTVRTCYPHSGVEFDELPRSVTRCNRWDAGGDDPEDDIALHDDYQTALDTWLAERNAEQDAAEQAAMNATPSFVDTSDL